WCRAPSSPSGVDRGAHFLVGQGRKWGHRDDDGAVRCVDQVDTRRCRHDLDDPVPLLDVDDTTTEEVQALADRSGDDYPSGAVDGGAHTIDRTIATTIRSRTRREQIGDWSSAVPLALSDATRRCGRGDLHRAQPRRSTAVYVRVTAAQIAARLAD